MVQSRAWAEALSKGKGNNHLDYNIKNRDAVFYVPLWEPKLESPLPSGLVPVFLESEGFILQRLRGDGMVFIHAGGTVVKKTWVPLAD